MSLKKKLKQLGYTLCKWLDIKSACRSLHLYAHGKLREQEKEIERDLFIDKIALVIHVLICTPIESTVICFLKFSYQ